MVKMVTSMQFTNSPTRQFTNSVVILLLRSRHWNISVERLCRRWAGGPSRLFGGLVLELVRSRDLLLCVEAFEHEIDSRGEQWRLCVRTNAGIVREILQPLDLGRARDQGAGVQCVVDLERAAEIEPFRHLTE